MIQIAGKIGGALGRRYTGARWEAWRWRQFLAARGPVQAGTAGWSQLRAWSQQVGKHPWLCDPERLADFVTAYDPDLVLERLRDARIVGGGKGDFNLNAYRCGTLNGVRVFEKIYQLDSEAWRRLQWAYCTVLPQLEGRVRTPRLLHRLRGRRLGVAYFEYLPDMVPIPGAATLDAARAFRRQVAGLDMSGADAALADFRSEPLYIGGATRLRSLLAAAGYDAALVEAMESSLLAAGTQRVFTHGDLASGNIMMDGMILDWDRCGAYPPGYEFGFTIIIGARVPCADLDAFEAVVGGDIERDCAGTPGSLEFFAAVFYARQYGVKVSDALILALFERAMVLRGIDARARHAARHSRLDRSGEVGMLA